MSQRAPIFFCPYCGDEDLRPHGETHGQWECRSCQRAFALSFLGLLAPSGATPKSTTHDSPSSTSTASGRRTAP